MSNAIDVYLQQIETALSLGDSTEHTHRPYLKTLVESLRQDVTATNEPKRKGGNAPDFIVLENKIPIGFIEAKDVGKPLTAADRSEQLKRYRNSLNNLILTDYLEFWWYENGELRDSIRLASASPNGSIIRCFDGESLLESLFRQFFETKVPTVTNAQELAERMATRAKLLEKSVEGLLKHDASPSLKGLKSAFKKELLPDLDDEGFADLYAQTVAYGLFTARVFTQNPPFDRQTAFANLPGTNPFLKRMFQQIAGFDLEDEPHIWAVDNIAKLLDRADMASILEDFGSGPRKDDPVVHFYETFLKEYDPALRELRGVYYTPTPVVSYIVRSVDAILKRDFGLTDGLADARKIEGTDTHKVLILDPATGTGTFLYKVIDLLHSRYANEPAAWKDYVSKHLLPRVFGFELLVAPYSIAHLKLGMLLKEKGYEFAQGERLNIFLTNSLDEMDRLAEATNIGLDYWIHEEAYRAQQVKQEFPVMVVLGNPPYSGHSANTGEWMNKLLRGSDTHAGTKTENYFEVGGEPLGEKNPKWLNNDYVKFIRFAQWRINQTGEGVLAFITSNSYLDSPTFRGMRESLMKGFDEIYILDLHGNSKKKERSPDGSPDQNVFDITEGVAIGIFVKKRAPFQLTNEAEHVVLEPSAKVFHFDLYGQREVYELTDTDERKRLVGGKYKYLKENDLTTTDWIQLTEVCRKTCLGSMYFFAPKGFDNIDEYCEGWNISEIMDVNVLGFQTHRDHFAIDFDESALRARIDELQAGETSDQQLAETYRLRDFDIASARQALQSDQRREEKFVECLVSPFDVRSIFYDSSIMDRPRREILNHVYRKDNLCLNIVRQTKADEWQHAVISNMPTPAKYVEIKDGSTVFPLYLYEIGEAPLFAPTRTRRANISESFLNHISEKLGLEFVDDTNDGIALTHDESPIGQTFRPEDVISYAYGVFHSPEYRRRYVEFLKIDFPRLPLTSDRNLFWKLVSLGSQLIKIHLLDAELPMTTLYPAEGDNALSEVRFEESADERGQVWINSQQYFDNIPHHVWQFQIGGHQVCEKWLKDRKGRILTFDDIVHYKKIVSALTETTRIMNVIDNVISEHGGFPFK